MKIMKLIPTNIETLKDKLKLEKISKLFSEKSKINYFIPALIILVYLLFFFIPEIKSLCCRFVECSGLKRKIAEIEATDIDSFRDDIAALRQRFQRYEKKLPGEKEIPSILKYLSQAAKKLDVKITEIKPVQEAEDKKQLYYSVPILLKAECGYHALGRFLNELERADRFMKIADLKMVANAQRPNTHYVQLLIVTYVMGQR